MRAINRWLLFGFCAALFLILLVPGGVGFGQSPASTVGDVIIRGCRHTPPEYIRSRLGTQPGQPYREDVLQNDVRTLYATGRFANITPSIEDAGPGKVKVVFQVQDYPTTVERIQFVGNKHISEDDLLELTGLRVGTPLNPIRNRIACKKIEARYREDGRVFAHCEILHGDQRGDKQVVFKITEGPKVRIHAIDFTGNRFVSGAVLATKINIKKYFPVFSDIAGKGTYNPQMLEADVHELEKYYKSYGYHDVHVRLERRFVKDDKMVDVIFHIDEGVRYRIKDTPGVVGVTSVPVEAVESLTSIKKGSYYNEKTIQTDIRHITDYMGYGGRKVTARAEPVYLKDEPGLLQVVYQVEESPPARVGQILIMGNTRTRQNVIIREVPLFPGQVLEYPRLLEAERNLARLGIFEVGPGVRPTVEVLDDPADPNSEYKDILVTVKEANTGSLLFGLGVTSDSGLTGSIVLNERNFDIFRPPTSFSDLLSGQTFRGAGQEFRLELVPGTELQRYTVSFREPYLFDSPYSLTLSGYYYTRFFNEYTERRVGTRATIGRKLSDHFSVRSGIRVEGVNVRDVPTFAPPDYLEAQGDNFQLGLNAGFIFDTRDSYIRPTEGSKVEFTYEQILGDHIFPLINADGSQYFTTYQRADGSGRQVLSLHSQVGWAGTNTPVYERFFAGGFRTFRGFEFRGVGPEQAGFKTGGTFLFLNSVEYQIPLTAREQFFMVGFVDSGTVAPRIDDWQNYRVSAGFGFRFIVPIFGPVPIALDFGFPIVKSRFDDEQIFNFWLGFAR
jgi:outer membrane protein insertion porin family